METGGFIWVILQLHVKCLNYLKLGDGDDWYMEIDFYPAQNIIPIARVNKWSSFRDNSTYWYLAINGNK